MAELFVTNFNRNFTGVSATAANVLRQQVKQYDLRLVGQPLPGCPVPINPGAARALSRLPPHGRPFAIWHVRRNTEMRAAIWARDVLRLPIRIVFTSAAQRRHSAFPRWLISRMDAVIATTKQAATFVPNVRAVVPHGVDTELFQPASDREAAWAALGYGGRVGVATVGRIRPEKGTDLFVRAMIRALPKLPDVTALVIGRASRRDTAFLADLKRQVAEAGLDARILFPSEIAPDQLPSLMPALSLVVQLPRYEGYGMVPLEAMASGVPFVGSPAGYYEAFSDNGQSGEIVPQEAPDAASEAIQSLLSNPNLHGAMARNARRAATGNFSAAIEAAGIAKVYNLLWSEAANEPMPQLT